MALVPSVPAAPGLFWTMMLRPSSFSIWEAYWREIGSVEPPEP